MMSARRKRIPSLGLAAIATLAALLLHGTVIADGTAPGDSEPEDPALVFATRLAALRTNAPDDAIELAQWATKEGLLDEADAVYRWVLREHPAHETAYYDLWHLNRSRDLPKESASYLDTRAKLTEAFAEFETRRYIILSDADPRWIDRQGQRLERTYNQFVRFVLRAGLRALPPRHKLVAVVFNDRDDFMQFAAADGAGGRIAGYYRQPEDRLVFYHVESNDNIEEARDELESMRSDIQRLHRAQRIARNVGRRGDAERLRAEREAQLQRHRTRQQIIEDFAHQQSVSVTVHEAIHQLMFHTGVQSRRVQHPLWLTEGLATAFETDTPTRPFGPRYDYVERRRGFYALLDQDKLMPLREMLAASPQELMAQATILYHQSYALVSWLAVHRKREFRDYLNRLNALPPGVPSAATQVQVFESVFGEVARLERSWLRYETGE